MAIVFSVLIPVLHEQERINAVISHINQIDPDISREIIVVDGDPLGSTLAVIKDQQVIRLVSVKGRGNQLSAAAAAASGAILLLLHADTFLPDNAFRSIHHAVLQGTDWGAFRLGLNADGFGYRLIELGVTLRSKLFTLPYGDQAMFVKDTSLQSIEGIPAIPLMEDVELARRLYRAGHRFTLLPTRVLTSARRWQRDGIVRRSLLNLSLLFRYLTGTSPDALQKKYQ